MIKIFDNDSSVTFETSLSSECELSIRSSGVTASCQLKVGDFSKLKGFLEKIIKGAKWWSSEVEWQSDDQRLTLRFEKSGCINVVLIPMMPEESPWVLQMVLDPGESIISDAIAEIDNIN